MSEASVTDYVVDLTNHSNRLRLESATPGRPMKVLLKSASDPSAPLLHGTGKLSDDQMHFTIDITNGEAVRQLSLGWPELSAELAAFSEFD